MTPRSASGHCTVGCRGLSRGGSTLRLALALVALCFLDARVAAAADLKQARQLLLGGEYARAEQAFKGLARGQRAAAMLGLARVQLETGRYPQALASARRAAVGKTRADAMTLVGEIQRTLGDRPAAEKTLAALVKRAPQHLRARALLGLVYHEQGKAGLAKATFDGFYDDFDAGRIDSNSAEQQTYLAMACRYTDNFKDADETLGLAIKSAADHLEAHLEWAEISLEKYQAGYAEKHYAQALKINPHHSRALVGMARVVLVQSNDVRAASKLLDKALATNPNSIDARVVQAQMFVDNEEHNKAEALLNPALAKNPNHLEALTMLAASRFLRDDLRGFETLKRRVLKLNPRYTTFFHTVVEIAVRHHRYAESIKLSEQAIKIDAQDWYSLADLGSNYLRMGDDDKGLKYLRQAWRGDGFNVRNFNLLNLYEDVIAKQYEFVRTKHFRLRVHKQERELLQRLVVPLLERAYAHYVKKYRFTPKLPITVEFFRDPQSYAVRTVGLPGLAALGVCFGEVITTTSPTLGRFNWGQVLWHELNHIFTIQLSRSRVPRWLTEGLADMEPALINKQWQRENDFDIYKALRAGRLHGLASMNAAFTRARSIEEMVVAYYQGSLMAVYLVEKWGLPKVLGALRQYAKGRDTEQILPAITGLSLQQLDAGFRAAQLKRLAYYNRSWYVDIAEYRDLERWRKKHKANPNDADAQAGFALALLLNGKPKVAAQAAKAALARGPSSKLALWASAQLLLRHDPQAARQLLEDLIAAGGDGFQARLGLGRLALGRKDLKDAEQQLTAASRFDPERGEPHLLLARAFDKAKKLDRAIAELKKLAWLEQQSFAPVAKLVAHLAEKKAWPDVRSYGEMAHFINPAVVEVQLQLAHAYLAAAPKANPTRALYHLEIARLTKPDDKRLQARIHVGLARAHLARNDKRRAREHYEKARKADPDYPELAALKKKL